jgi:hypothetical protein
MHVPDVIMDCVCFVEAVEHKADDEEIILGTAFVVVVDIGFAKKATPYIVTAKHCLGDGDEVILAFNGANGSARVSLVTKRGDWLLHPTADVAAINAAPSRATTDYKWLPAETLALEPWRHEFQIGPGDELFVTGLLIHHIGVTRNMPIVRLGCIAALPADPVKLETGADVVALAEVRSIGGLSGSPVFVHLPFWRDTEPAPGSGGHILVFPEEGETAWHGGEYRLLGLMHGFYPVGKDDPDNVSGGEENLNTGIAVVVLADRIMDIINRPDQIERRETMKKKIEESQTPVPTSGEDAPEYERFEELAKKLVNTPKPNTREERKGN